MPKLDEKEEYRREMLQELLRTHHVLVIYGGDDENMNNVAREANQFSKIPLLDRHKILREAE